jgi:ABC-2 type transport system ATP-binding protein
MGYLGPNGAGKTTTIRLLLGLARPTSGSCTLFGIDAQRKPALAHRRLAYVAGDASLWPSLTGRETLQLLSKMHGGVDLAYQEELIGRFDLDPDRLVRTCSRGNHQKLVLIAALSTRAELLVLDEPTTGLDPIMEQVFRHCINEAKANGQAVFLSSHQLSEVEALCDRVALLGAGRLVDLGSLAELRHLASLSVEATFTGPLPDLSAVPGVSALQLEGQVLRCQVSGDIEPLLRVLAHSGVHELLSREPSLEELFLAHYGTASSSAATDD